MIWSIRKTINSVIREQILDDDGLNTVFCEIESTLNSRPITMIFDDPNDSKSFVAYETQTEFASRTFH